MNDQMTPTVDKYRSSEDHQAGASSAVNESTDGETVSVGAQLQLVFDRRQQGFSARITQKQEHCRIDELWLQTRET